MSRLLGNGLDLKLLRTAWGGGQLAARPQGLLPGPLPTGLWVSEDHRGVAGGSGFLDCLPRWF
jgi:hypothetical protein